ncbi:SMAD/FHA domain-containing protein [Cokeromyces recurvatus]|uniref:SMAD/FHA domain-containing protein n=1 Tax=Cokeromyces recurvatus TaxID=90255 RepID=UPI00221F04E7|nr:SMAD/FHA domain-containing protein [Cokeromyces recurvatus]KAI7900521.1 SMAD/FHA domain-containing protein [Cokeromyces recurvatus]
MSNDQDFNLEIDDYINSTQSKVKEEEDEEENKEDWTYDELMGVYVIHSKRLVMYYNNSGWVCGDYKAIYESNPYIYDSDSQSWFNTETKEHFYYDQVSQSYIPLTEEYWAGQPETTRSIRFVILSSPHFQPGQVVIIDENGITIGRDRSSWDNNRLRLPEMIVSKYHALVYFDKKEKVFYLVDNGSQHGTFANNKRLSESKQSSLPYKLQHLDKIQIGSTCIEVHEHSIDWPCQSCVTSLPIDTSSIGKKKKEVSQMTTHVMSPEELELRRREWNRNAKRLYTFDKKQQVQQNYVDRAEMRRKTLLPEKFIRIEESTEKKDTQNKNTSHTAIQPVQGIGNKMLQKLGWQEGQRLGKNQSGILEPLMPTSQLDRSGLGSQQHAIIHNETRKDRQWRLAQERYEKSF